MSDTQAMIWFIVTALAVVALLGFGMYEGTHAYDNKRHHGHPQH
ncbi:MAG TPA: hypothetical protein VF426_10390 [Marmoricola sp.]